MKYVSTRGGAEPVSFLDAVLAGLAPDGGLYVPQSWPKLPAGLDAGIAPYAEVASALLKMFAGDDLTDAEALKLADAAYGSGTSFTHPAITPLKQLESGTWLLELFHGPSLAFKDVAMQLIGPLYDHALAKRNERLTVVCATSGDTGGAAVEALKGRDRVDLFVLLPKGRVSDVQRRFMTASGASNVHALELDSDFDACQAIVKMMFADAEFAKRSRLSGVNSINWARIVAQSVYFCVSSAALNEDAKGVDFIVPTGNFGDAFSAWVAKRVGAPVERIAASTNANDVLVRALETGVFDKRESLATLAPAMDIQSPSNFERVLYDVTERDSASVAGWYASLAQSGSFTLPEKLRAALASLFDASRANDADLVKAMKEAHAVTGELICPHTASAWHASRKYQRTRPTVLLATAHPAKFPETVEDATGVHPPLPGFCADLYGRKETFDALAADAAAVKKIIAERSRAWS